MFKQGITEGCGRVDHYIERDEGDGDIYEVGEVDGDDRCDDVSHEATRVSMFVQTLVVQESIQ